MSKPKPDTSNTNKDAHGRPLPKGTTANTHKGTHNPRS
jgi:hypothetical protein